MRIRLLLLISVWILSCVNVTVAEVDPIPQGDGWDLVQTEHFSLHTDAQVRFVKKLGLELESLRAMLALVTPDGVLHSTRPTTIFVFKSLRSFDSFRPLGDDGRRRKNVGGYFLSRYDGNFMTVVADAVNDVGYEAVLHEYVHFVIDHTLPSVPAWFNEGTAQYYGTFASNKGSVDVGRINRGAMIELQRGWALPIEDLFGVDYQSPIYRGPGSIRHTFYAESWAVVHYFYHGNPERLNQLQHYLKLLNNGIDRHEAFSLAFGIEYSTLQEEVRTYIRSKVLPLLRVSKDQLRFNDQVQTRKVSPDEMKCRLGELVAHMGDVEFERAETIFRSVVARNSQSACGLRGLGYVARERGQRDAAESFFSRAEKAGPEDYLTLLYRGENLVMKVRENMESPSASESDESEISDVERARALFRRAIALKPEWGEAWVELGRTWSSDPSPPEEALESLLHGLELMPFRDDVAISLAAMYAGLGLPDHVEATMRGSVRGRLSDEGVRQFNGMIQNARWNAARNLQQAGDLEGAVAHLEAILKGNPDESRKQQIDQALLTLRQQIKDKPS